jgi:hypothetical protein
MTNIINVFDMNLLAQGIPNISYNEYVDNFNSIINIKDDELILNDQQQYINSYKINYNNKLEELLNNSVAFPVINNCGLL